MCGRRQNPRPCRSRLSRPAAPPGSRCRSIHSAPRTAAAPRSCRGGAGSSRGRAAGRGHNPRPESRPRRDSRPRVNRTCRGPHGPAPDPKPAAPPSTGQPPGLPRRGLTARESRVSGVQRRPEVSPAPPPQRPTSSPPRPDPSPRCLGPLRGCREKQMPARQAALEEESRARGPKPAWAVTLMILRGSPAILSDPEFGLCSCLRLRSPHARVEVPGSTSGERRRARRRCLRRGPSGNVVPARARASHGLPSDLVAPSPALPAPTPAGGGGSDAPRWGRDFGGGGARRRRASSPAAESERLGVRRSRAVYVRPRLRLWAT